jgi:hypothetical protein
VTASKSPERTTVMTFGSANATLPGAVTRRALLWALVGNMVTLRIAQPAMGMGRPDGSAMSWLTYLTERVDGSPPVKLNTTRP